MGALQEDTIGVTTMNQIRDILTKSFEPSIIIKVEQLNKESISGLLDDIHLLASRRYKTLLDAENAVIYLKRKK